jgi:hypothetical protein
MRTVLWLSLTLALCAFGQIREPQAGWAVDSAGGLRPLLGVSGSYVWGEVVASPVESFAVSSTLALWKAGSVVRAADRTSGDQSSIEASGPTFLSGGGLVYFAESERLFVFRAGSFAALNAPVLQGRVLALGGDAREQVWLVRDADRVWRIRSREGEIVGSDEVQGVLDLAVVAEGRITFAKSAVVVLREGDQERRVEFNADVSAMAQIDEGSIWVRAGAHSYVVRLRDGQAFELPEVE